MDNISRRDVVVGLSAVAATGSLGVDAQPAAPQQPSAATALSSAPLHSNDQNQAPNQPQGNASGPPNSGPDQASASLARAGVFRLDDMPVRKMANGGESADLVRGAIATGEWVNLHESVLPTGVAPNKLHRIDHSEFILIREGQVAFEHDGKSERVGPGDAIYVAYGTEHTLRNVGDGPAKYFVVGIGGDIRK